MRLLFVCTIFVWRISVSAQSVSMPDSTQEEGKASFCGYRGPACHNDVTPAGVMIGHLHEKNQWMFSYRYMGMYMQGTQNIQSAVNNDEVFSTYLMSPREMHMHMHMLMAMYGITNRITVMAMGQFVQNQMEMDMFAASAHQHNGTSEVSHEHTMKTSGISDTRLQLMYGLIRQHKNTVMLTGGVSAPTGKISHAGSDDDPMYRNKRLPYGMQTSTGTWDVLTGLCYVHHGIKLTFSSQVNAIIRTGYNSLGYAWGNEYNTTHWLAYSWKNWLSSSLRVDGILNTKMNGYDSGLYKYTEPAAHAVNYGGKKIQISLGSSFSIPHGFLRNNRFSIEAGLPVYQYVNGYQMPVKCNWYAAWTLLI